MEEFIDDNSEERPSVPFDTPPDHLEMMPEADPATIPPDEGNAEAESKGVRHE